VSRTRSLRGAADDPARTWLEGGAQVVVREANAVPPAVAAWDLGLGESHVLAWAHANRQYEAILDDQAARKCAQSLGVPVRGTIGVLLLAKKEGRISQVRPLLDALTAAGVRIDPSSSPQPPN